jgi:hypothetical protein
MPSNTKAEMILSQFPGPVTLYPSKKKWLLIFVIGILLTASGHLMIGDGVRWGWFVFVFFACGSITAVVMLLPGAGALLLDKEGFQATSLFGRHRSRWQDTSGFEAVSIPPSLQKMVVYDDAKLIGRSMAKINVGIAGHNAGLPDTYGLSADGLAHLMARCQARARV